MKFLIFVLGFFAFAVPNHGQITGSCITDTTKCETVFTASLPNDQGSHAIYCQLATSLVQCVDVQSARTDCPSNAAAVQKLRKKAQELLNLHKCAAVASATKCQTDLDKCTRDFNSAIAQDGYNQVTQCSSGAVYIKCLTSLDTDTNCKGKTSAIDTLRKKTQEDIAKAGCGNNPDAPKTECNNDVKTCELRFKTDVTQSGTNVKQACAAGAALEICLKGRETLPDCKGSKSYIDTLRKSYKEQIDQTGCSSAHAMKCVQGVQNCTSTYNTALPKLTTADTQCSGANTYIGCLNTLSCSAGYRGQLKKGVDMVTKQVKGGNCHLKSLRGSAWTVKPTIPALFLLVLAILVA